MSNSVTSTADKLEEVINEWRGRLLAVSPADAHAKPSPDRWSISEVMGHLVDSANNNHQRFVRAQLVDSLQFPKYDQNAWVAIAHYREVEWASLVELWYHYNRLLAVVIRNIPESSLAVPCTIGNYDPCTLTFLVTDYLDHMNHHLRILAERVGP
jgi:hypothetical protein